MKVHSHDPLEYGFSLAQGYESKLAALAKGDEPIKDIKDPRYGVDEPGILEDARKDFIKLLQEGRKAHSQRMTEEAGCFCDGFSNVTVWDSTRNILCKRQEMLAKKHFPQKYLMDPKMTVSGAPPKAGLRFAPSEMKKHFRQYRAMLAEYYEGKEGLEQAFKPGPSDPGYDEAVDAIARRLVRKVIHNKPFVVAVAGVSIMAGMDNCFAKSYGPMMTRYLEPFFKAMGISIDVRNSGQNGDGPSMEDTTACIKAVMGDDVDILQITYVMINIAPAADYEAFIRRTITDGTLVHATHRVKDAIGNAPADLEAYYKSGVTEFTSEGLSALDSDPSIYPWWPKLGRAHWGRAGDGRCHMTTRDGSDGTIMQDWHPGPLGFQVYLDTFLYTYMDAFARAMDMLDQKDVAALKEEFPVDANLYEKGPALPSPVQCKQPAMAEHPLCKGETDHGFKDGPFCAVGQKPSWGLGVNFTDWFVPADDEHNPFKGRESTWTLKQIKHKSGLGQCRDQLYQRDKTAYTSRKDCLGHLDEGFAYAGKKGAGWVTFKLPDMTKGDIQVCNYKKNEGFAKGAQDVAQLKPQFALNGRTLEPPAGAAQPGDKVPFHPSVASAKASTCMQVAVGAPEKEGAYLSVSVDQAAADNLEMHIAFIIVQ